VDGRRAWRARRRAIGAIGTPRERTLILNFVRLEDMMDEVRRLRRQQPQQQDSRART
jgi:hypothetical protein